MRYHSLPLSASDLIVRGKELGSGISVGRRVEFLALAFNDLGYSWYGEIILNRIFGVYQGTFGMVLST